MGESCRFYLSVYWLDLNVHQTVIGMARNSWLMLEMSAKYYSSYGHDQGTSRQARPVSENFVSSLARYGEKHTVNESNTHTLTCSSCFNPSFCCSSTSHTELCYDGAILGNIPGQCLNRTIRSILEEGRSGL